MTPEASEKARELVDELAEVIDWIDQAGCVTDDQETILRKACDRLRTLEAASAGNGAAVAIPREPTKEIFSRVLGRELYNMDRKHFAKWAEEYRAIVRACDTAPPSQPELCDDEGCPHFGTPHVCNPVEGGAPIVAWEYELATARFPSGEWTDFAPPQLTHYKPNVPEGSIRNLRALVYAESKSTMSQSELATGLAAMKEVLRISDRKWPQWDAAKRFIALLEGMKE